MYPNHWRQQFWQALAPFVALIVVGKILLGLMAVLLPVLIAAVLLVILYRLLFQKRRW